MSETKVVDKNTIYSLFGRRTKNTEKKVIKEGNKQKKININKIVFFLTFLVLF